LKGPRFQKVKNRKNRSTLVYILISLKGPRFRKVKNRKNRSTLVYILISLKGPRFRKVENRSTLVYILISPKVSILELSTRRERTMYTLVAIERTNFYPLTRALKTDKKWRRAETRAEQARQGVTTMYTLVSSDEASVYSRHTRVSFARCPLSRSLRIRFIFAISFVRSIATSVYMVCSRRELETRNSRRVVSASVYSRHYRCFGSRFSFPSRIDHFSF
jgi:hypothetical protein